MSTDTFDLPAASAHDDGAEQAILGVLLAHPDTAPDVRRLVSVDDFYKPAHSTIFATICTLDDNRDPIEPRTIASALTASGEIKRIPGGAAYLADLFGAAPPPATISHYTRLVRDAATRRGLASVGMRMQQMAAIDGEASPADIVEKMRSTLDELAVQRLATDVPLVGDILNVTLEEIDRLTKGDAVVGLPTGFRDLDKLLNGMQPGQMITIAARPGVGKSTLAMDLARNAAFRYGKSVAVFSLEMSAPELVMRMLASEAYVELGALKTGQVDEAKWQQLIRATQRMSTAKLAIDDTATITMSEIRAKCRALQRIQGLDLVVIDYIQLMNSDRRTESRQQEVSDISRAIKLLAKEFKVPVIALSQLNRGSEQRADKRPMISDLRESGSIEQDSDVVILIHREELYDRETPRAGEADVHVAKQRSGPQGMVTLAFVGKFTMFADLAMD